jgi:hypothetical protein
MPRSSSAGNSGRKTRSDAVACQGATIAPLAREFTRLNFPMTAWPRSAGQRIVRRLYCRTETGTGHRDAHSSPMGLSGAYFVAWGRQTPVLNWAHRQPAYLGAQGAQRPVL